jgi:hypothetical protein
VCAQIHFIIFTEAGVKLENERWYEHESTLVETSREGKVTLLWSQQVQTARTIPDNKPDIIICDNEKGTHVLLNVAVSGDRIVTDKEAEKILKYKDLNSRNKAHVEIKKQKLYQ